MAMAEVLVVRGSPEGSMVCPDWTAGWLVGRAVIHEVELAVEEVRQGIEDRYS